MLLLYDFRNKLSTYSMSMSMSNISEFQVASSSKGNVAEPSIVQDKYEIRKPERIPGGILGTSQSTNLTEVHIAS